MTRRPPRSTLFPSTRLSRPRPACPGVANETPKNRAVATAKVGNSVRLPVPPCESTTTRSARHWEPSDTRSEEHTSELQSRQYLVCRLLLEKKKKSNKYMTNT